MSRRTERVGDQIREILARLIREEVRDPRIGFVTLTDVEVSADLRYAKVFVTSLQTDIESTVEALNGAAPFLQREVGRQIRIRHTPLLRFHADVATETGLRVESLLREAGVEPTDSEDS